MRLFRSEEHVRRMHPTPGELFEVERLWRLAALWYGDRLHAEWWPRTGAENQGLLDAVGLTGPFWQLAPR